MRTVFINGRIVTPNEVLNNHNLVIENGKIIDICDSRENIAEDCNYIDVENAYIMAGLIDIHSDMIESLIQPRSTALMDFTMGLQEAEKQLAVCGITTMFHSVSMYKEGQWDTKQIRTAPMVKKLAKLISEINKKPHLINNRYHLRYEIDNIECYNAVWQLMEQGYVQLLSLMNHSPCQGQYRDLSIYRKHLPSEGKNLTDEEFNELIERELSKTTVSDEQLKNLTDLAHKLNIPISSHDDDTSEKIVENQKIGVSVSEFPITMETAKTAHNAGLSVLLGAPNILRGKSHSGNLSAIEAVKENCADILCSDYYPQALMRAVFHLASNNILPLPEACNMASLNPAKATGLGDITGSIEKGKNADILIVSEQNDKTPLLKQTWVLGHCVFKAEYFSVKGD